MRASATTTRISRSSRTRGCPADTNVQVRLRDLQLVELAHVHATRASGAGLAFNNDFASPDFGKWNGSVTDPRDDAARRAVRVLTMSLPRPCSGRRSGICPPLLGVPALAVVVLAPSQDLSPALAARFSEGVAALRADRSTRPKRRFAPCSAAAANAPSFTTTSGSSCSSADGTRTPSWSSARHRGSIRPSGRRVCSRGPACWRWAGQADAVRVLGSGVRAAAARAGRSPATRRCLRAHRRRHLPHRGVPHAGAFGARQP